MFRGHLTCLRVLGSIQAVLALCAHLLCGTAAAQQLDDSPGLQARMAKEKEDRKACKTEIFNAIAQPSDGTPVRCSVTKTWLASEIQSILGDRLSWPWGQAQCSSNIELDRNAFKEAANQPKAQFKLKRQDIICKLDSLDPKDGTVYDVKLSIEPFVTFEAGKPTKVDVNWGEIEAPILATTAFWQATANAVNFRVISEGAVREINAFLFDKYKEADAELKPQ
jgi:hypothetical protein